VADLRGLDPTERANAIIDNCAHPKFRKALHEYFDNATASCKYKNNPVDMNAAVNFDKVCE
ncbi:MAG: propionyl-CoA--succinate CoA transferase, partial [Oscillospiraceae bacterium]|nr:propionyl-CoA--succinate CoA transferase [Oscillospiraceae bacterium]